MKIALDFWKDHFADNNKKVIRQTKGLYIESQLIKDLKRQFLKVKLYQRLWKLLKIFEKNTLLTTTKK